MLYINRIIQQSHDTKDNLYEYLNVQLDSFSVYKVF
jgi:hypothetical protein